MLTIAGHQHHKRLCKSEVHNSTSYNSTSSNSTGHNPAPHVGEFWAGATIGTLPRMEAIPGRIFYDFDGKTVKDPVKTFGDASLNAFRLEAFRGGCLGPTEFINNATTLSDELLFKLDWGCLDLRSNWLKEPEPQA